jgi:hypothetical protein
MAALAIRDSIGVTGVDLTKDSLLSCHCLSVASSKQSFDLTFQ